MANFQPHYDTLPNGSYLWYSDTAPATAGGVIGRVGDLCLYVSTAAGSNEPIGWICTVAGTAGPPSTTGTWVPLGIVQTYATAGGANNAITVSLPNIPLTVGMILYVNTGTFTLTNGANTLAYNGASAVNIKSHLNKANNIATAYSAASIVPLMWDGTEWQDLSQ